MNNEKITLPIFKCRASAMGLLMTGYKSIDEKGLERIKALDYEHQHGINLNGNKVKWTDAKQKEIESLIYLKENPELGETAKSYLKEWVISQLTEKQKDIQSKYLKHGIENEQNALDRASKYYKTEFSKNTNRKENDFFSGEWDSKNDTLVIDVKCPWDEFTFPYFDEVAPKGYYEQLQVYMDLTGLKKASLTFCLENATEDEIDRKAQRIAWEDGREEPDIEDWNEAKRLLTHDHLPDWMRIKTFEFECNDELLAQMKQRVIEARVYINDVITPMLEKQKADYELNVNKLWHQ